MISDDTNQYTAHENIFKSRFSLFGRYTTVWTIVYNSFSIVVMFIAVLALLGLPAFIINFLGVRGEVFRVLFALRRPLQRRDTFLGEENYILIVCEQ